MLSRDLRLPGRSVAKVLHGGNKANLPTFFVKYLVTKGRTPRFSIVVSKKINKRATQRNLIKRRVAHVIREYYPNIHFVADIVISVKAMKEHEEYKKELEPWLARLPSQV